LDNQIFLKRIQLNEKIIYFLKENLNILNTDYLVRKDIGKSTYNIDKYFKLVEETADGVMLPRGFVATLVDFCRVENIPFNVIDKRRKLDEVHFDSNIDLLPHQKLAVESVMRKDFGVIVSPPGSGKTIIGLEIKTLHPFPINLEQLSWMNTTIYRPSRFVKLLSDSAFWKATGYF